MKLLGDEKLQSTTFDVGTNITDNKLRKKYSDGCLS